MGLRQHLWFYAVVVQSHEFENVSRVPQVSDLLFGGRFFREFDLVRVLEPADTLAVVPLKESPAVE